MEHTIITITIFLSVFIGLFSYTVYAFYQDDAYKHEMIIRDDGSITLRYYWE